MKIDLRKAEEEERWREQANNMEKCESNGSRQRRDGTLQRK